MTWKVYMPKSLVNKIPIKLFHDLQKTIIKYEHEDRQIYKLEVIDDNEYVTSILPMMDAIRGEKSLKKILSPKRKSNGRRKNGTD